MIRARRVLALSSRYHLERRQLLSQATTLVIDRDAIRWVMCACATWWRQVENSGGEFLACIVLGGRLGGPLVIRCPPAHRRVLAPVPHLRLALTCGVAMTVAASLIGVVLWWD